MNIELFNLITPIATYLTILVGFVTIIKFLFSIKDEISKLTIRIERLESKFDILVERQSTTKEQIINTNQRIDRLEIELREQKTEFKEFINK